jgi:hypothetical protein
MTNPTSNFGWQMPTSTDLVTDLPADFETFGQAVDTSLADLKGGTSGQILAKASNTDMDFTWVTNDVGDITAVTAGTGITGGGTSGAVTVSFDQANYGGGQFAAGKNKIINGDFSINQRAFTTATTDSAYLADRFAFSSDAANGTKVCTYSTFTPGSAPVAGYEASNYLTVQTSGQSGAATYSYIQYNAEDVRTLAGQTVTMSFWAKAATGTPKISLENRQNFGSGGSTAVNTNLGVVTLSTTWARYSVTATVPSVSGKTIGTGSYSRFTMWVSAGTDYAARTNSIGIQSNTFDIWGVQVEAGSVATPFQTATGNPASELQTCQRYYYRINEIGATNRAIGNAFYYTATNVSAVIPIPTTMRVSPTIDQSTGTDYYGFIRNGAIDGFSSFTIDATGRNGVSVYNNADVSGTAGQAGLIVTLNTNAYLAFSAEL